MIFATEKELVSYGKKVGQALLSALQLAAAKNTAKNTTPRVIELVGDVGAGKTTFTRGIAEGLDIQEPITSPSFTIAKRYAFSDGFLTHYDFYRLPDPGLMLEDLSESISDPNTIVVLEWADTVQDILPANRRTYKFTVLDDGNRKLEEL